ncbi:MAG: 3'-5' exonuclease [Flavobacteriia bacterium]|nr:3'-5' exonuclease [Flavobacteriia bacterium]
MKLNLTRPIAFFDIESTGINVSKDRIVEIAIVKINVDGSKETFHSLVNPQMSIPAQVVEIHGIDDDKVKNAPIFSAIAEEIKLFLNSADLAGYNSYKLDIPLLVEEFLRAGTEIDFDNRKVVDVQNIFHKMEQRTLSAAYKFYCNKDLQNAHSALIDTEATLEVLESQLDKYSNLNNSVDFLSEFSSINDFERVDFAGRLAKNAQNKVIYNFGKHKGKTVEEVMELEQGYYGWFVSEQTDFPKYSKLMLKKEMLRIKESKKNSNNLSEDKLDALKNKFNSSK